MRYAAVYLDIQRRQTFGRHASEAQATRAWLKAAVKIAEGRLGDARRGR
jgi:hypothetical protein